MHQSLSTSINSCALHNNLLRRRLLLITCPDGETEELKDQMTFPNAETEMPINSRASAATHCTVLPGISWVRYREMSLWA